nr:hypothetical protein Clen_303 [Cedratvirus lena]
MSYAPNSANFYSRSNLSRGQGFAYPGTVNRNTQGVFVNGTQATSRNNYGYSSGVGYGGSNGGYRGGSSSVSTCPCARGRR